MDRRRLRAAATSLAIALPIFLAACGAAGDPTILPSSSPSPSPSPGGSPGQSPSPTPASALATPELKLRLLAALGTLWYCDPDEYPVARDDEAALAAEHLPGIQADAETWSAITAALGFEPAAASYAPDEQLAIYRLSKSLAAIELTPLELTPAGEEFGFDELFGPGDPAGESGERIAGSIARDGTITVGSREASGPPMCPICLARGTAILTPDGPVAVERLGVGDSVWTLDRAGRRVAGTVLAVASAPVPAWHRVVSLVLSDGRAVDASPGHPLADGRALGALRPGDIVDGARVVSAWSVAYDGLRTFDLVVSGPTGLYLAGDGIPLASTIER